LALSTPIAREKSLACLADMLPAFLMVFSVPVGIIGVARTSADTSPAIVAITQPTCVIRCIRLDVPVGDYADKPSGTACS